MGVVVKFPDKFENRIEYVKKCRDNIERVEEFRDAVYRIYDGDVFIKGVYSNDELIDFLSDYGTMIKIEGTVEEYDVIYEDGKVLRVNLNEESY